MTTKQDNQPSLLAQVRAMEVGDQLELQVGDYAYATIRGYASALGFDLQRKFSTKIDRKNARIYLIRVS